MFFWDMVSCAFQRLVCFCMHVYTSFETSNVIFSTSAHYSGKSDQSVVSPQCSIKKLFDVIASFDEKKNQLVQL